MGIGPSYKMVVDLSRQQENNDSEFDWIAQPPREGEARVPPMLEKGLVVGDGPILGKGAYGVTHLSKSSFTGEYYAVKVIAKAPIFKKKSILIVQAEVDTLARMKHPFIVHLFAVHQDDCRVALVMEFAAGGELLFRIRKRRRLPDTEAKFYAAEIADALRYMHNEVGIIYHDLKPENILLAADGHVKVVDFGLALDAEARQWDECRMGTSMYMAPELAKHRVQGAHAPAVDWWSFGCVVYEMLSGSLPFGDSADLTKYEIYTNITEKSLRFGKGFGSKSRALLKRLLDKNPVTRLGWEGVQKHKWFRNVDWVALRNRRVFPPWVPPSMKPGCTECFLQWKPESPPPQPPVPGKTKGSVSRETSVRTNRNYSLQRVVMETMGGRYSNSTAASISIMSSDQSPTKGNKRGSNEEGGGAEGRRRYRESANVGSQGGGNAKRRFKSAAARVVADRQHFSEARPAAAGAGGSHRPTPHDPAARNHRHNSSIGGGGGGGASNTTSSLQRSSTSKKKLPARAVGYR
ncbi:unnamed protein product [Pylaiella littoralis]